MLATRLTPTSVVRAAASIAIIVMVPLATACAHRDMPRLKNYDLRTGYRFDRLKAQRPSAPRNSDDLFVMLAFSGGGTRAASMSYGALAQLRATRIYWDSTTRAPCDSTDANCRQQGRSLLDEVDVISSVSGGSFTAAYYALYGNRIFDSLSTFQRDFLFHRVQSDLVSQGVYYPRNWRYLFSRAEIAADYHERNIFDTTTFAALANGARPFLILNATHGSTGFRFEFTQEQLDPLCADLSPVPVARGVAASSSFPILLNSLRMENFSRANACSYTSPTWVANAKQDRFLNPGRYRSALELEAYRDSTRPFVHLLDGGLADNLGVRRLSRALSSSDVPDQGSGAERVSSGFSVQRLLANGRIKKIIVIVVDARTGGERGWDRSANGPLTSGVIDAAVGIPMGNYTTETLEQLRSLVLAVNQDSDNPADYFAMSVGIDQISDEAERKYLAGRGTNFELTRFEVECLMSRSADLLKNGEFITSLNIDPQEQGTTFDSLMRSLGGSVNPATVPRPRACTEEGAKQAPGRGPHTVDVLAQREAFSQRADGFQDEVGFGLGIRVARPSGLGASFGLMHESFRLATVGGGDTIATGRVRMFGATVGGFVTGHFRDLEASLGVAAGGAFTSARQSVRPERESALGFERRLRSGTWIVQPRASLWWSVFDKVALTTTVSYLMAQPAVAATGTGRREEIRLRALGVAAGVGWRVY